MEYKCANIDKYASNNLINRRENNFLAFRELINSKSYVPLPSVLLDHVLTNNKLSELEKLSYLTIYSLSFINLSHSKHRSVGLSAVKLGKIVGCSKSQILAIEKNLSDKGYLRVIKQKNKFGQDNCNLLSPTLPNKVFAILSAMPDRRGLYLPFNNKEETQLSYLERTKQYIPLNYQIFKLVVSNTILNSRAKILWLASYIKAYKNTMTIDYKDSKQHNSNDPSTEISFTSSYVELAAELNCSYGIITTNMNLLVKECFLSKKRFHVKNGSDLQERCDKSLWHITTTLPAAYKKQIEAIEDRRGYKPKKEEKNENHASENRVGDNLSVNSTIDSKNDEQKNINTLISDPDTSLFRPHLIKALKINRKNRSNERADFQNFEKERNNKQNNWNKEEKEETSIYKKQQIVNREGQILNLNKEAYSLKRKSLSEVEPINEEEAVNLRDLSGRNFSCAYMNKLLERLAILYPEHKFYTRRLFLKYMSIALAKELRETTKANNIDFRFKQEVDIRKREKYLEEVETGLDTSPMAQLKKKIAGVFDAETAYHILTSVHLGEVGQKETGAKNALFQDNGQGNTCENFSEDEFEDQQEVANNFYISSMLQKPKTFLIELKKELNLSEHQQEVLLGQVRSIYGNKITKLAFKKSSSFTPTKQKETTIPEKILDKRDKQALTRETLIDAKEGSIWHKVSQKLIAKHGIDIYKAWFGQDKMKANYDEIRKTLSLKASMNFIACYVQSHYFLDIYDTCRQENYQLSQIS